jgi:hypothetical protein
MSHAFDELDLHGHALLAVTAAIDERSSTASPINTEPLLSDPDPTRARSFAGSK